MMKKTLFVAAASAALAVALPAHAWWHHGDPTSYNGRGVTAADNAFHWSAATPADEALARRIVNDLAGDRMLNDTTATIAVNHGDVGLSGSSRGVEQAERVERIARADAGYGHVAGKIDTQGG